MTWPSAPRDLAGRHVVVLGLGRFGGGQGAVRWLLGQGARVTLTDAAPAEKLQEPLAELREHAGELRTVLGGHAGVDFGAADLLVVNPAVPLTAPPVRAAQAAGVPVSTEIALLVERWPGPIVGVTGSNGKSTTTSLTHALLVAAGARAELGGNIGGSLLGRLGAARPGDVAVLEISSFMLEILAPLGLGPDVGLLTNITPNHLDRHPSFEQYVEAKSWILRRAHTAVLYGDDPVVLRAAAGFAGTRLLYGASGDAAVTSAGDVVDGPTGRLLLADAEMPLPGAMNRLNVAAALLAAGAVLGAGGRARIEAGLRPALAGYRLPPDRMELVGEWGAVRWVNDSVSTTPESTEASLQAVRQPCILIAGGHDKGLDCRPLVDGARRRARHVLTIGEQGPRLLAELTRAGVPAEGVGSVAAAVARAASLARAGDTVLLSPGYSSHDQFTDYTERARVFAREVRRVAPGGSLSEDAAGC